ncbi:putative salt-induced outer membrane protein [Kushneria marisflavi]|uniref:Uncharacterized protein n=2 Tax=Kushneria marisflavi TaxID=157779 RepID=A0A240US04_9GAMM|nr:hypothetical protein B9H00_12665 [Kushneria marisflavi]RKD85497.1 putative salt-induced outer membrane protein [Kushneria marisflavi]
MLLAQRIGIQETCIIMGSRYIRFFVPLLPLFVTMLPAEQSLADDNENFAGYSTLESAQQADDDFDGEYALGYTKLSGNSNSSSLRTHADLTWYNGPWSWNLYAGINSASDENDTSAENYNLGGRTRYSLDEDNYLFGLARWRKDRFAGYNSQSTLAGGYGRQLLSGPPQSLSIEAGPGVRRDSYTDSDEKKYRALAYGGLNYRWQVSDTATFGQDLVIEATGLNLIMRSQTSMTVSINDALAMRLSYDVDFNDDPPEDAQHKTDTTTAVSVVYDL